MCTKMSNTMCHMCSIVFLLFCSTRDLLSLKVGFVFSCVTCIFSSWSHVLLANEKYVLCSYVFFRYLNLNIYFYFNMLNWSAESAWRIILNCQLLFILDMNPTTRKFIKPTDIFQCHNTNHSKMYYGSTLSLSGERARDLEINQFAW